VFETLRAWLVRCLKAPKRLLWRVLVFFTPPADVSGYRLTWKRLFNLYLNRYEIMRLKPILRSRPTRLVVEPTNVCNLRCPYCHTGAGRFGRKPAMMRMEPYRKVIEEIGEYLLLIEVFNWGEALLNPQLPDLIAVASARGIATRVNTNFSVPFTTADAERLVASGLTDLFVSVDGPTQEIYERYRVGGDLELVARNCRLLADTKARLGQALPRLTLQFLEFPFNATEGEAMRRLAAELDMHLFAVRGALPDKEWGRRYEWPPWWMEHAIGPCSFLWSQPVLTVDGNIAPCRGVFQSFDDVTPLSTNGEWQGAKTFQAAWNHERYQSSRSLFLDRAIDPEQRALPCHECPTTVFWQRWVSHRKTGGTAECFDPQIEPSANGAWNYFWARGQKTSAPSREEPAPAPANDA
jgi:pyruvate-formate lyase-activating enzyme